MYLSCHGRIDRWNWNDRSYAMDRECRNSRGIGSRKKCCELFRKVINVIELDHRRLSMSRADSRSISSHDNITEEAFNASSVPHGNISCRYISTSSYIAVNWLIRSNTGRGNERSNGTWTEALMNYDVHDLIIKLLLTECYLCVLWLLSAGRSFAPNISKST